jgi:hypothetical protein
MIVIVLILPLHFYIIKKFHDIDDYHSVENDQLLHTYKQVRAIGVWPSSSPRDLLVLKKIKNRVLCVYLSSIAHKQGFLVGVRDCIMMPLTFRFERTQW